MPFQLLHYKPAFLYSLCVLFQRTILLASLYRVATWFFCAKVQAFHNVKRDRVLAMDANFNMAPGSRITEGTDRSKDFLLRITKHSSARRILKFYLRCTEAESFRGKVRESVFPKRFQEIQSILMFRNAWCAIHKRRQRVTGRAVVLWSYFLHQTARRPRLKCTHP